MFRTHQDAFGQLCYDLRTGGRQGIKTVVCSVTPGGGKSLLPVIAAAQLLPDIADRICWIVPRRALQMQAEEEFLKARGRDMLGHNYAIRRSSNEPDPCRGFAGFVTTYQAVGTANDEFIREFSRRRYALILDEPHHVEEGSNWEAALEPLVKRAAVTVLMSGTLERGNRKRIAFLPYRSTPDGEVPDLSAGAGVAALAYSRMQALAEKAILPLHFELMDGRAEWVGRDGATYSNTLSESFKDANEAIYTALKTQFGEQLLNECTAHWRAYRETHPHSKLLVVTADITDARKYVTYLKDRGVRAAIATSDDSARAQTNIEAFKRGLTLDALVTVAMAYEGLDVPAITHIACLTHIRSRPWIEQMLARATRFNPDAGPWETQTAYVYVPDDRLMVSIINSMQGEQQGFVKNRSEDWDENELPREPPPPPDERNNIQPVGSEAHARRQDRIGTLSLFGEAASGTEDAALAFEPSRATRPPLSDRTRSSSATGTSSATLTAPTPTTATPTHEAELTPSRQEAALREAIQDLCKTVDTFRFSKTWGETSKRIVKRFGVSRARMTIPQLRAVLSWLQETFPEECT